jgi:integrase/recombinase XerD
MFEKLFVKASDPVFPKIAPHAVERERLLEKPKMRALLAAPARRMSRGIRDYAVLLFLYNAGARADEAARLTVADLDLGASPAVKLLGTGNKTRLCPLWSSTAGVIKTLVATRSGHEPVFLNRRREAVTRFGIYDVVTRHAPRAAQRVPSIGAKRIGPHVIRPPRSGPGTKDQEPETLVS